MKRPHADVTDCARPVEVEPIVCSSRSDGQKTYGPRRLHMIPAKISYQKNVSFPGQGRACRQSARGGQGRMRREPPSRSRRARGPRLLTGVGRSDHCLGRADQGSRQGITAHPKYGQPQMTVHQ